MKSSPAIVYHGLCRIPSELYSSTTSFTTSQVPILPAYRPINARMWDSSRRSSNALFSGVGVIGLPAASLNTQAGT